MSFFKFLKSTSFFKQILLAFTGIFIVVFALKQGLEISTNHDQKIQVPDLNKMVLKDVDRTLKALDLDFIVSCWDSVSLDLVEEHLDVKYHKVASALATDKTFLQKLNDTKKPIILSVGMCTQEEVDAAVEILDNVEYILACTSTYPTKADELNLKYIHTLKEQYPNIKVGFSNHYNGLDACVGSIAFGAECVEFHICLLYTSDAADE